MSDDLFFVRRYRSPVAHVVLGGQRTSLCHQWVDNFGDVAVEEGELPLCKRCQKRLVGAP